MVHNVISDLFRLSVKRHYRFFKNIHFFFDVCLLKIHSTWLSFSLSNGVLKHHKLLVKSLSFIFNFLLSLLEELFISPHFLKLISKIFRSLLFFLGLISDTWNFRFNLKDIILLLLDELLDGLQSFISLLHTKERFLPIIEQSLFRHYDLLNFNGCFLQGVSSRSSLLLLRNQLSLIEGLLFIKSLDLFIHWIN